MLVAAPPDDYLTSRRPEGEGVLTRRLQAACRGGPCLIRARRSSGSLGGVHGDSIHHVAPASALGRTMEAARSGSSPGVCPSQTMSKAPSSCLFSSAYSLTSRMVPGVAPDDSALSPTVATSTPS